MLNGGSWIFLSHSSHDIKKVRMVRNEFERLGHNPLAFHLKCLSDNTEEGKNELFSLIEREIDARQWFVFCESPSAKQSSNVQREREYIKKTCNNSEKLVCSIDLTQSNKKIRDNVKEISEGLKVFISYSYQDQNIIQPLINALVKKDYSVWYDKNELKTGDCFESKIKDAIYEASHKGFIIVVLSGKSLNSSWQRKEISMALSQKSLIIPLVISDYSSLLKKFPEPLKYLRSIPLEASEENYTKVVNQIDNEVKKMMSNISSVWKYNKYNIDRNDL